MKLKSDSRIFTLLKTGVSLAALVYVYFRLTDSRQVDGGTYVSPADVIFSLSSVRVWPAVLAFVMIPLNLGLEAFKWQVLVRPLYGSLRFGTAFRAVFTGISFGILTPNRWGDYAGRVLFLPEGRRMEAAVQTFIDRLGQMAITLLAGSLCLILFRSSLAAQWGEWMDTGIAVSCILLILTFALMLRPRMWMQPAAKLFRRFPGLAFHPDEKFIPGNAVILSAFGLSVLRYAVFTAQYLLLLYAFGLEAPFSQTFALVCITFLLKSVVPFIGLAELGVREMAALETASVLGLDLMTVFKSTVLLYVFNIILPALAGLLILLPLRMGGRAES